MAIDISSTTRRIVYTGSSGVGPYSFAFEVLAQTDIAVYFNTTELTLTTDYTVSLNVDGTGSVTIVTGSSVPSTPTASDRITIIGDRTIERSTDFTTGGPLFATSLNDEFDSQTIFVQQVQEQADRSLRAPNTDPTTVNMVLPFNTERANKYLSFDASGNPTAVANVGKWRGDWTASTDYVQQDIVKDTTNDNIYICITTHTSSGSLPLTSNADYAKWDLVVDAATAAASAAAAAASATAAASSATAAASSATSASSSATSAASSATTATTQATNASTSATSAASSASAASTSATNAATSETNASTSATAAASSASAASTSATSAASSATTATTQASNASTSATSAASSATTATTQASNAATSATSAASSAAAAAASAASIDAFYLGALSSDPTVDGNGDPVTAGDWYFNTSANETRIYNGSTWQVTAVSTAGLLTAANNLSDLSSASTARTNLGLGTAATTAASDYATAAQGTLADSAVQPSDNVSTLTNDAGYLTSTTGVTKTASTGSGVLPNGTTAQRDGSPSAGYIRFNTTTVGFEGYDGSAWGAIGGGASAGGAIYENNDTITSSYTIAAGKNGHSVGPITISSGAAVTITSGQRWVVA
jgi:hypothetical protein